MKWIYWFGDTIVKIQPRICLLGRRAFRLEGTRGYIPQMYSCSNKLALIHLTLFIFLLMNLADTIRALKCLEQIKESVSLRLTDQPQHEQVS